MLKKPEEALRLKRLWQLKSEKRSYSFPYPYFPYSYPYYSLHEARAFQASSRLKRQFTHNLIVFYYHHQDQLQNDPKLPRNQWEPIQTLSS